MNNNDMKSADMFLVPGESERNEMLLPLDAVEVSEAEVNERFSASCEDVQMVKRLAEGKIAEDIRNRMNAPDDADVFITEMSGVAQIGDETWENFQELVIECNGVVVEFDSGYSEENNFVRFLNWLKND